MKKIFLILSLIFTLDGLAHEGHDHNGPSSVRAPKGGVLKTLEKTHVELVAKNSELKFYLYDLNLKPKPASHFKLKAQVQFPRDKKLQELAFATKEFGFEANFESKGVHRYTLLIELADPETKHPDKLSFTIEPKR